MDAPRAAPLEIAERKVRELGRYIKNEVPHGWGYMLCLTEIGDGGRLAYASDCSRDSVVAVSRELANRIDNDDERALSIIYSDETLTLTIDKAMETLAMLGRAITAYGVEVYIRPMKPCGDPDEQAKEKLKDLLEGAIGRAESLVLMHRPDLLTDDIP